VFEGYQDEDPDVPPVFNPGELLVIIEVEPDDVFRCLAIRGGKVMPTLCDIVRLEEITGPGPVVMAA
jgi:hypothetical protein